MQNNNLSVANILIFLCLVGTLLWFFFSPYQFGIQKYSQIDTMFLLSLFTAPFLHGGILHFFFNSAFLYYFGNVLEVILGKKYFLGFFIFTIVITGILVALISSAVGVTIGMSGFCMAIISYYTLELKSKNNPEWKGGVTAIILNIALGFYPGISMSGHLFGALAGVVFFILYRAIKH